MIRKTQFKWILRIVTAVALSVGLLALMFAVPQRLYGAPAATHNIRSNIDLLQGGLGWFRIRGWAFDYDSLGTSLTLHVYINGPAGSANARLISSVTANTSRADVNNAYPGVGVNHGFDTIITTDVRGALPVYIYALNVGAGDTNPQIGSGTITISDISEGGFVNNIASGKVYRIAGGSPMYVSSWENYGGQKPVVNITDSQHGGMLKFPRTGTFIRGIKTGAVYRIADDRPVYISSWDLVGGEKPCIDIEGSAIANQLNHDPNGKLDEAVGGAGQVTVKGWAWDGDLPTKSVSIRAYVGGDKDSKVAEMHDIGVANVKQDDVSDRYIGVGDHHGFSVSFQTQKTGSQPVYVYALNHDGTKGGDSLIGSQQVNITQAGNKSSEDKSSERAAPRPGAKFKVTFNPNWGKLKITKSYKTKWKSCFSPKPADKTVAYGKTYGSLPSIKKQPTGYKFAGWWTAASGGSQIASKSKVSIVKNSTLYAHWAARKYTVKFVDTKGKVVKQKKVAYGKKYGKLPEGQAAGWEFLGWYTKKQGGKKITAQSVVAITANMMLYPHWKKA